MFNSLKESVTGYKLFDLGNNRYKFVHNQSSFDGSLADIFSYAVLGLGFDSNELEYAIVAMEENFHNTAEFGMFKTFMFSYDKEENDKYSICS